MQTMYRRLTREISIQKINLSVHGVKPQLTPVEIKPWVLKRMAEAVLSRFLFICGTILSGTLSQILVSNW